MFISGDYLQWKYYTEEEKCHIPYFKAYSTFYNVWWVVSRFMQSISANLIALMLMWRPKVQRLTMDPIE
jgi:hypothetical protein